MKKFLVILIATSLTANAWLALRLVSTEPVLVPHDHATVGLATSSAAQTIGVLPWQALETGDVAACRDALLAAGAGEATTRAVIDGVLRQRYRDQLKAQRIERQTAWWRNDPRTASGDDTRLLDAIVRTPLREALGRDPLTVQDAERRYDFLPPGKRRIVAEIALDYEELGATGAGWISGSSVKADIDRQQLLADERRKDVIAALTPAERAEYELRFEGSAGLLSGRLAVMNGTEQEFRALRPLLDAARERGNALPAGRVGFAGDEGFLAAFAEFNQQELDKIAAAIGPERSLDYQWSGPGLYAELVRFATERGLPSTTAASVMQLAAETGARASSIHNDATIPVGEKGAALQRLQAKVRSDFDRLIPESLRADLPAQGVDWFTLLAEGRYMGFTPSLLSTGTGTIAPTSVAAPRRGPAWSPPPRPQPSKK